MATSLRDIPGGRGRPGHRRSRGSLTFSDAPRPAVLFDPREALGGTAIGGRRRIGLYDRRRRRLSRFDVLLILAVIAVALFLARAAWSATRVHVEASGLERQDALTVGEASSLHMRIVVRPSTNLPSAQLLLDGRPLDDAETFEDGYAWAPQGSLTAGHHRLELVVPRPILPKSRFVWDFVVDATPPRIESPRVLKPHGMRQPVVVDGRVDPDATLIANGEPVKLDDDGSFRLRYPRPPAGPVLLTARDQAGHVVKRRVFVPVERPIVRGVHMSAISWRTPHLRRGVLDLVEAGKINAVQLDLKDESGEVGYDSTLPMAKEIGATKGYYDLRKAVDELHRRNVRVIGRIVVFRDPILASSAWADGHRDWVVQKRDGTPHAAYGGFTNMAAPAVQQYNLDVAAEAIEAGVDEILWDYIRRPEGDLTQIVFPGMESSVEAVEHGVVQFLAKGHQLAREHGVFQGASLFGIAAGDPDAVGQNVAAIARHTDYLAPMVYPSLWVPGEYRVADPTRMPFAIVARSLGDFKRKSAGTGVHFTPWLQDFSLGAPYGDAEVRAQIDAAEAEGIHGWLLWSPRVNYHGGHLPRR